jgi:ankyrin repeat protein
VARPPKRPDKERGWTPLFYAAQKGHKDVVELLLAHKPDVNAKDKLGATPLHAPAGYGRADVVELLLANKAEVNVKAINGVTPLNIAISQGTRTLRHCCASTAAKNRLYENRII